MQKRTWWLAVMILVLWQGVGLAVEQMQGWADLWNNFAYDNTNFESQNFKSGLLRMEGRMGVYLGEMWKGTRFMPYIAYVAAASGNPAPWNNTLAGGIGFRCYPFAGRTMGWMKDIKFYAEALSLTFLRDRDSRPTNDTRIGFDLWYEWNQPQQAEGAPPANYQKFWGETWSNITYRQTNFEQTNFNTILANFQVKNGLYMGGGGKGMAFEPYVRTDLTFSGRRDFWLNNFVYGAGIRIQPFRKLQSEAPLLYKLKIFLEAVGIAYFGEQPTDGRPNSDVRFGVDCSLGR